MEEFDKTGTIPTGVSPENAKDTYDYQNELLHKSEVSRVRSFAFERRQRLPYLITKGLAKPGTISFDILRRAATSVHVARICVNVLKEKITKTKWAIQPINPLQKVDEERVKKIENLFRYPNRNNETFRSLLDKILEDLLVLDAVAIEKTRYPNGEIAELHYVDAATIRPVFDEHGNQDVVMPLQNADGDVTDLPVSYVQVIDANPYGGRESGQLMGAWPKRDFMYFSMHPQGSMGSFGYGLSPLEAVVGVVANILNADNFNGTYFEEGAFPPMIIQLKQNMEQRQLQAMREYLYNELEGRYHRPAIIAGDAEMDIKSLKEITQRDMQFMDYMNFMARLLAAAYGLSGQDIGLTDDLNRATSEVQKDLSQAKGYGSILHLLKEEFNEIIWKDFGYDDLEFEWIAPDTTDPKTLNDTVDLRLKNGTITLNEARKMLGEEPFNEWGDIPRILTGAGYINLAAEKTQVEDKPEEKKEELPIEDADAIKKAIQTTDGVYRCFVSDLGVGQPFIFYNILNGHGYVIKPPVAVNLTSQKMEEEITNQLYEEGLHVVPVKRYTETEIIDNLFPSPEIVKEFVNYQNMTPTYDSEKWRSKYGGSRKYPYYLVSRFVEGRTLKDALLIEDMKRVPAEYYAATEDLANLWLAEKKHVLGDRRADQVICTLNKRIWGFDYQFKGNQSRYDGTKNAYANALSQIPELYELFMKLIGQEIGVAYKVRKFLKK